MIGLLRSYVSHHPVLGTWGIPDVRVIHPMRDSKEWFIHMNGSGIRDRREFEAAVPEGKQRVVALGDSFLFGFGVEETERFSSLLEESLSSTEIINLGLCSSGIDQQSLVHREIGSGMNGRVLLWSPYLNNVGRCQLKYQFHQDRSGEVRITPKPFFRLLADGSLALEHVPVPRAHEIQLAGGHTAAHTLNLESGQQRLLATWARRLFLHQPWKYDWVRFIPVGPYPELKRADTAGWQLASAILSSVFNRMQETQAILAPMPSWSVICNPGKASYRDLFATLHDPENGVRFVDLLPAFTGLSMKDRKRCFLSPSDNHYSVFGHQIVAEALHPHLDTVLSA